MTRTLKAKLKLLESKNKNLDVLEFKGSKSTQIK